MNKLIWGVVVAVSLIACQENESSESDFTGNETTYALVAGSEYDIHGTVTFQERKDGTAFISIAVSGTEGSIEHPVHLHLGNIASPDEKVYANLNPISGKTGKSETLLKAVADESAITYQQLVELYACMKIHLSASGPDKDIILAAGNVGTAFADDTSTGRLGISACQSE